MRETAEKARSGRILQAEHKAAIALRNAVARQFVERALTRGLKPGKKRDDLALEFMLGAVSAIILTHPAAEQSLGMWCAMGLILNPYEAVVRAAGEGDAA